MALTWMFASPKWLDWNDRTKLDTMVVSKSIFRDDLWEFVTKVVGINEPLVKVLRIVDGEDQPMGYIYESMDRAKVAIRSLYKGDEVNMVPYEELSIPSGTCSYIHCCMHQEHISIPVNFIIRGQKFKKIPR